MADHHKPAKRTSFIGKRLGGLLRQKSSKDNSASSTAAPATTPGSVTPTKSMKKMRLRKQGSKRLGLTASSDTTAASMMDDIPEPSARASQKQQHQQHVSLKQLNTKQSSVTAVKTKPQSPTTSTSLKDTSASGMRQRLQEIEAMIAAGKEEMGQLQAAEAVKLQAVARGFIVRRRLKANTSSPKPTVKKTGTTTPPKRKKKRVKKQQAGLGYKQQSMKNMGSKQQSMKNMGSKQQSMKHMGSKQAFVKSMPGATTTAKRPAAAASSKTTPTTTADERKEAAAAIRIQSLIRGFCSRQRAKKMAAKLASPTTATTNTKPKKEVGVPGPDHYSWDKSEDEPAGDHYAWNEGDGAAAKPTDKSKDKDATANTKKAKTGIHHHHTKRRSLTKDQANAIKNGPKQQKAKARRTTSLRSSKDSHDSSTTSTGGMNEYSWKDHSMRDLSMKDQSSAADHSMPDHHHSSTPFHDLSSGSITNPNAIAEEEVFEDSEHSSDLVASSAHTSKRSSIASSFISKLTDGDDEGTFEGSFSSREEALSDALSRPQEDSEEEEEPDLLDLSVMATAPTKHTPSGLTEKDLRYFGSEEKHREEQDDLSVSLMALSSRRSDDSSSDTGDDEYSDDDDSRASYAYNTAPHSSNRRRAKQHEDDLSVSVMAVAEVSDLEVESEFEIEDYETEYEDYDEEDYDEGDFDDDLSDTVMAVALPCNVDFDDDDEHDDASVAFNTREDDMSITTCETDLPREQSRDHHRRRRRNEVDNDTEDEIIEAEDVSVLSTASNKRHKKNNHNQRHQQRAKRQSNRNSAMVKPPKTHDNQFLLPQYHTDSSEEESYLERKRRQRRSRRSITKKGQKPHLSHHQQVDPNDEEELQRKLAEINRLIEDSKKEMEELVEVEAVKIQAWVRMHQERKIMDSSGRSCPEMRNALSRAGTKEMNNAAASIQSMVRGYQARDAFDEMRRSRKRRRNRKQRRARELEQKAAEEEARLKQRLLEVDREMKCCKDALEARKATMIQSQLRGFFVRSKDLLNPEKIAAVKIQRLVRTALSIVHLRKRLAAVAEDRVKEVQAVEDNKKKTIAQFEPGKFDNMDTRVKMVNFLKKQIEKENETIEKWVTKIKNVKENNVRLMTANSSNVCAVARLEIDVEAKEEKRDAMLKLNQQWIDGIKEYENRVEAVVNNTKTQAWQKKCCQKYINLIANVMEERYPVKKLVKEVKFIANHSDAAEGSAP